MNKTQQTQGNLWLGLFVAAVGGFIMLVALGAIPSPEESFHAPRWVVAVAGLSFFGAGVYVSLVDPRFLPLQEEWWFRLVLKAAQASMPLALLTVLNWVAFAPGDRQFSSSVSVPFFSISSQNSGQIMGRCVFGTFAVISDLLLVFIAVKAALDWVNGEKED